MNISLEISYKSLIKHREELCGDKVEMLKSDDSDIIILADGMGSGVKANILATLTSKILGTMLKNGAQISDCVETIAKTLPVCRIRQVAYSTFSILQIFKNGDAYLVEYDNPGCVLIRDNERVKIPYTIREVEGKPVREYRFKVAFNDYFVLFSDGVTHAGVGRQMQFGWGWHNAAEYIKELCAQSISAARLTTMLCMKCNEFYHQIPGDDTTVAVARIVHQKNVNIFSGPPESYDDDELLMKDFMASPGMKIISGGTSANIASRILKKRIVASLDYADPEVPPIAMLEGVDLVTEGVLTLNKCVELLKQYNSHQLSESFFEALDARHGAALMAKALIEDCTNLNMFVGRAMNAAHQNVGLPFDLSIRQRLVGNILEECRKMGKEVSINYY